MLDDPEMGFDFIQPVKSGGVREMGDSVMTIPVKFTAKPGAHFVIRREAFKRITEALEAQGIHYAHRKVIVEVAQTNASSTADPSQQPKGDTGSAGQSMVQALKAGAAAAIESVLEKKRINSLKISSKERTNSSSIFLSIISLDNSNKVENIRNHQN